MKSFKDKMYNYEVTPPSQSWQIISTALDKESIKEHSLKPVSRIFYLRLAAASVALIIIVAALSWFGILHKRSNKIIANQSSTLNNNSGNIRDVNNNGMDDKITVPGKNEGDDNVNGNTLRVNQGEIITSKSDAIPKKYITISGPEGQPVKISAKAASLIVSSDDQYPPNTIWDDKVKKWKDIMKANTLAPTTANFLDIVELTQALKIQNP